MKKQLSILKDERLKANTKKIEDLAINLKLMELKELNEKLEKEKKAISDEIDKNNKIYEKNQKRKEFKLLNKSLSKEMDRKITLWLEDNLKILNNDGMVLI